MSHAKLASAQLQLGNAGEALAELRKGRDIMTALSARQPENTVWQQYLAWFNAEIARLEERR